MRGFSLLTIFTMLITLTAQADLSAEEIQQLGAPEGTDAIIYQSDVTGNPQFMTVETNEDGGQVYSFCRKGLTETNCLPFGDASCAMTAEKMEETVNQLEEEHSGMYTFPGARWGAAAIGGIQAFFSAISCVRGRMTNCRQVLTETAKATAVGGVIGLGLVDIVGSGQHENFRGLVNRNAESARSTANGASPSSSQVTTMEVQNIQDTGRFLRWAINRTCINERNAQEATQAEGEVPTQQPAEL